MHKKRRQGVSETNRVVRSLKLDQDSESSVSDAIREIDSLYAIEEVSVGGGTKCLHLAYDASRLSIDGIETILAKHCAGGSRNWWTRMKEGHYRFADQNAKDSAALVPSCCNIIAPGARGK